MSTIETEPRRRGPRGTRAEREAEVAALPTGPFPTFAALEQGVPTRVLRRVAVASPHRGVRLRASELTFEARCAAALLVAPEGSLISHASAARLHGLRLPSEVPDDAPVHVTRPRESWRLRHVAIVEHTGAERRRRDTVAGLCVTSAAETWGDLALRMAPADLVAMGDGIAATAGGTAVLEDVLRRRRGRGTVAMRQALPFVRSGSASRMESLTRFHIVEAGLPEPLLNAELRDERGGWVARVDFLWPQARLVAEFQGKEFHLGSRRDHDETRRHDIEDHGYAVVFITAAMLATASRRHALCRHLAHRLEQRTPR